ncbi:MAG TPA: EF-hand domain-containing protein [Sphingomicrobium sp.]
MHKLLFGGAAAAFIASAAIAAQPAPLPPPGVAQGTTPVAPVRPAPNVRTFVHRMPMKAGTRDEVVAHVRDMFARLDGNKDGYVTREEADAAHKAMAGEFRDKFTKRFAAGGDFPHPDRGAMFDRLDTNKDGSISRQEYMSAKPDVRQQRVFVMRDGQGPVEVGGQPGAPGVKVMRFHRSDLAMGMHKAMFERADANRDGRVSLQEMTNAALHHFDEADANHDGRLTPDERMRMRQQRKAQRMQPA